MSSERRYGVCKCGIRYRNPAVRQWALALIAARWAS